MQGQIYTGTQFGESEGKTHLFCSTIIPTIGRSSLSKAVESLLHQDLRFAEFEIIVVNDSGQPLPQADWQSSWRVRVIDTWQRERSVARNSGAALARGRYLLFLDDDDWLAAGALQHIWELSQRSNAPWLYGISQLLDRDHRPILQLRHGLNGNCFVQVMAGEWIPLQSSLIDTHTFFKVGGFNPLISGPEDIDLLRRISLIGEIAETPNLIAYIVRGEAGSTTDYEHHSQASRWAREKILESPNVFSALRSSAIAPSWQGRMFRIYITSLVWNISHRRVCTAFSRATFALATLLITGLGLLSVGFWGAVGKSYSSDTFNRGFQEASRGI